MTNRAECDDVSLIDLFGWYSLGDAAQDVAQAPSVVLARPAELVSRAGRHRRGGHSLSVRRLTRGHHARDV